MKDFAATLPGLDRIKTRFITMLEERQGEIAHHAFGAWDGTEPNEVRDHLEAARDILHKIAGSAGSLGFGPLGQAASDCEKEINVHLESANGNTSTFPITIMERMDTFVSMCQALLADGAQA